MLEKGTPSGRSLRPPVIGHKLCSLKTIIFAAHFFRIRLAWFGCVLSLVIHLWRCRPKCFSVKCSRLGACFLWCIRNGVFFTRKLRKFEGILLYKGRGQFSYYSLKLPKASDEEQGQPQPLCPSETSQQTGLIALASSISVSANNIVWLNEPFVKLHYRTKESRLIQGFLE